MIVENQVTDMYIYIYIDFINTIIFVLFSQTMLILHEIRRDFLIDTSKIKAWYTVDNKRINYTFVRSLLKLTCLLK